MTEAVRKLKINRRLASSACSWCGDALALGEDGAVCEACESPHHASCWDMRRGCGLASCFNAPLPDFIPTADFEGQPNPNEKRCPSCRKPIAVSAVFCRYCNEIVSADGLYHGEQTLAREAREALLFSIIGLFVAGLILGPVAFMKGSDAKKHITNNPRLRGRGMATTARLIGVGDVVLAVVALVVLVRRFMNA